MEYQNKELLTQNKHHTKVTTEQQQIAVKQQNQINTHHEEISQKIISSEQRFRDMMQNALKTQTEAYLTSFASFQKDIYTLLTMKSDKVIHTLPQINSPISQRQKSVEDSTLKAPNFSPTVNQE